MEKIVRALNSLRHDKRRLIAAVTGAGLLLVVAAPGVTASFFPQKKIAGKTLREWVQEFDESDGDNQQKALEKILRFGKAGDDAVGPLLEKVVDSDDTSFQTRVLDVVAGMKCDECSDGLAGLMVNQDANAFARLYSIQYLIQSSKPEEALEYYREYARHEPEELNKPFISLIDRFGAYTTQNKTTKAVYLPFLLETLEQGVKARDDVSDSRKRAARAALALLVEAAGSGDASQEDLRQVSTSIRALMDQVEDESLEGDLQKLVSMADPIGEVTALGDTIRTSLEERNFDAWREAFRKLRPVVEHDYQVKKEREANGRKFATEIRDATVELVKVSLDRVESEQDKTIALKALAMIHTSGYGDVSESIQKLPAWLEKELPGAELSGVLWSLCANSTLDSDTLNTMAEKLRNAPWDGDVKEKVLSHLIASARARGDSAKALEFVTAAYVTEKDSTKKQTKLQGLLELPNQKLISWPEFASFLTDQLSHEPEVDVRKEIGEVLYRAWESSSVDDATLQPVLSYFITKEPNAALEKMWNYRVLSSGGWGASRQLGDDVRYAVLLKGAAESNNPEYAAEYARLARSLEKRGNVSPASALEGIKQSILSPSRDARVVALQTLAAIAPRLDTQAVLDIALNTFQKDTDAIVRALALRIVDAIDHRQGRITIEGGSKTLQLRPIAAQSFDVSKFLQAVASGAPKGAGFLVVRGDRSRLDVLRVDSDSSPGELIAVNQLGKIVGIATSPLPKEQRRSRVEFSEGVAFLIVTPVGTAAEFGLTEGLNLKLDAEMLQQFATYRS